MGGRGSSAGGGGGGGGGAALGSMEEMRRTDPGVADAIKFAGQGWDGVHKPTAQQYARMKQAQKETEAALNAHLEKFPNQYANFANSPTGIRHMQNNIALDAATKRMKGEQSYSSVRKRGFFANLRLS